MIGRIFNIQRCSLHDGPGIRTTVFMKGCPLRCAWCQNPEGLSHCVSSTYDGRKCISCGCCKGDHSPENASSCPTEALSAVGKDYTVEALVSELLADADFFGQNGGVTFSGGECLLQSDFVLECTKTLGKHGIKVAVDTCGAVDYENIEKLIPYAELFLYDIKAISEEKHVKFTGVSNTEILSNFKRLCNSGARVWVRVPIIATFNENKDEIAKIKEFLDSSPSIERIEALKYHELGLHKYELLGLSYTLGDEANISQDDFEKIKNILNK